MSGAWTIDGQCISRCTWQEGAYPGTWFALIPRPDWPLEFYIVRMGPKSFRIWFEEGVIGDRPTFERATALAEQHAREQSL